MFSKGQLSSIEKGLVVPTAATLRTRAGLEVLSLDLLAFPKTCYESEERPMPNPKTMSFARIYPLYVQKAARNGRTKAEVDEVIFWLTGHMAESLRAALDREVDFETFFVEAPCFQPKASLIKGVVCGVRVEEIEDETMRK